MRLSNLQEANTCNSLPVLSILRFLVLLASLRSNENKMSDGGRESASLGVELWKSSQKWSVQRSAVRSIAWLGVIGEVSMSQARHEPRSSSQKASRPKPTRSSKAR